MPIAIPSVADEKTEDEQIYFSSVNIPVFNTAADITEANCAFDDNSISGSAKRVYHHTDKSGFIISNPECRVIYNDLCTKVKTDRARYLTPIEKLYGPYPDTRNSDIVSGSDSASRINKENQYIDCNCKNSIYQSDLISVTANTDQLNPNTLAQSLDSRCSTNASSTYKLSDDRITNLCLNTIKVGGSITASDQAALGLNQKCNLSTTNNNTIEAPKVSGMSAEEMAKIAALIAASLNTTPPVATTPAPVPVAVPVAPAAAVAPVAPVAAPVAPVTQTTPETTPEDVPVADEPTTGGQAEAGASMGPATEKVEASGTSNMVFIGGGVGILILIIIIVVYVLKFKK
jgi:hypothetical protein